MDNFTIKELYELGSAMDRQVESYCNAPVEQEVIDYAIALNKKLWKYIQERES